VRACEQDRRRAQMGAMTDIRLLLTLGLLLGFASLSTDIFLPALPAMAADLGAAQAELELVVSVYLLGF